MKALLLICAVTLSATASAGRISAKSDWAEIEASRRHNVIKPMEFNAVGGAFNACIDGDVIRSIQDVRYCAEGHQEEVRQGDNIFWEWVCDRSETAPMEMPRLSSKRECVEYYYEDDNMFCKRHADKPYLIPLEYTLEVQEQGGEDGYRLAFKKKFTVPACN